MEDRSIQSPGIEDVDTDALTPVVRAVIQSDSATVDDWSVRPLGSGDVHFGGGSLFVVRGTATDRGSSVPWSVVLKPIARNDEDRAMDASEAAGDYAYWKREPLAYASGVLDDLPGSLAAPACYGVTERGADRYWIWLEQLGSDGAWPLERYGTAARHLGTFNGAYLAGTGLPAAPWMASARSVQTAWGASNPFMASAMELVGSPASWQRDEICRVVDPLDLRALADFFGDQDSFVRALQELPQTFSHNDAMRPNLFAAPDRDGAERTVAIDWQFPGHGPIGGELAMLVAGSVLFLKVLAADVDELAELTLAGYAAGLEAAGAHVDERDLRFGFAASATLRCGLLAAVWLRNALEEPAWVEQIWNRPAAEVVASNALLAAFLDRRAAEARQLLG